MTTFDELFPLKKTLLVGEMGMNRPGINISMFGVFTTDLTVFVAFDLMFRPKG